MSTHHCITMPCSICSRTDFIKPGPLECSQCGSDLYGSEDGFIHCLKCKPVEATYIPEDPKLTIELLECYIEDLQERIYMLENHLEVQTGLALIWHDGALKAKKAIKDYLAQFERAYDATCAQGAFELDVGMLVKALEEMGEK